MWNFIKRHKILLSGATLLMIVALLGIQITPAQTLKTSHAVSIGSGQKYEVTIADKVLAAGLSADYTCNGTNDNVVWQNAINAVPANGGIVNDLTGGLYVFAGTVNVPAKVTINGIGRASYFSNNGVTPIFTSTGNGTVYQNISTDNGGINTGATTGWLETNVAVGTTLYTERSPNSSLVDSTLSLPTGRTASYVIAASDSSATAKSQADYVMPLSTTDLGAKATAVFAAMGSRGGTIELMTGTYSLATTIQMYSYNNLVGENFGWFNGGVILDLTAACNAITFGDGSVGAVYGSVRNMVIFGNNRSYAYTYRGIVVTSPKTGVAAPAGYSAEIQVENVRVSDFKGAGLYLDGTQDCQFKNIVISACGEVANAESAVELLSNITTAQSACNRFEGLDLEACYYTGVYLDNYATLNQFIGCKFDSSQICNGFRIEGHDNLVDGLIAGISLDTANKVFYQVENGGQHAYGNQIINSTLINNTGSVFGNYDGIYNDSLGHQIIVQNNSINLFHFGIKSNGTNDIITGNRANSNAANLSITGISQLVVDNDFTTAGWLTINYNGTLAIIRNNLGFNPQGKITTPIGAGIISPIGSGATVTASTDYVIDAVDCFINTTDSSNTNCSVVIKDNAGNTIQTLSGAALPAYRIYLPIGYKINWGAFTGTAPTVTVFGN